MNSHEVLGVKKKKRIGLMSDTHGFLDDRIFHYFEECDEIWHAGDVGNVELIEALEQFKMTRAVFGNIDGHEVRRYLPEDLIFETGGAKILMTHIAGYPGRYNARVRMMIEELGPDVIVCGHSHILKVIYDKEYKCLSLNPGACGKQGFHKVRTLLRFTISSAKVSDMDVVELQKRI